MAGLFQEDEVNTMVADYCVFVAPDLYHLSAKKMQIYAMCPNSVQEVNGYDVPW